MGCQVAVLGWRLRIWGLSNGSFRLGADDMLVVTVCDSFKLEAEDMGAAKWQF